ncbi:transcriptional regulator [Actinoplanes sp. NPDC051851]|uniref:transcriptional regulator n=1 Tax=Actinoplanes sp. NPDC051851 TaxID=3154753 RepID=UPI003444F9F5
MTYASTPELLVLHGIRASGMARATAISQRTGIAEDKVTELLGDFEAYGWVTHVAFGDTSGWTLTERGRDEDGRRLAAELDRAGARHAVEQGHAIFETLNGRLVKACTDWQLRPTAGDRLATNDHRDTQWDEGVLDELTTLDGELKELIAALAVVLARFGDYHERFSSALARARAGEQQWVAGIGVPSCHAVWMELHEDLLSTLGIPRDANRGDR